MLLRLFRRNAHVQKPPEWFGISRRRGDDSIEGCFLVSNASFCSPGSFPAGTQRQKEISDRIQNQKPNTDVLKFALPKD
jgi:hypothetical protein